MESRRSLKIRIKLGNIVKAVKSAPASGANADRSYSSASHGELLLKAKRQRKLLEGYPAPSDSALSIVAALRNGCNELQPTLSWDESLDIPASLASFAAQLNGNQDAAGQRHKRCRPADEPRDSGTGLAGIVAQLDPTSHRQRDAQAQSSLLSTDSPAFNCSKQPSSPLKARVDASAASAEDEPCLKRLHSSESQPGQSKETASHSEQQYISKSGGEEQHVPVQPPGSSTSDEANNRAMHSPGQTGHADDRSAPSSCGYTVTAACNTGAECTTHGARDAAVWQEPLLNCNSIGCQAGNGILLAPSCLDSLGSSTSAASMCTISPFDLSMPRHSAGVPAEVDDKFVDSIIQKARSTKYAADKLRGSQTAPWAVDALCKYVESAVVFMEACEYMLRAQKFHDRVASLYGSTANLLLYSSKAAEAAMGPDLSKDALRILAERLCAVCNMREAANSQSRLLDASARAQQMSTRYSQQQQQAAAAAPPTGSSSGRHAGAPVHGKGVQPSPDDSANSSRDVLVGSLGVAQQAPVQQAPAMPNAEGMQRLLEQARQVARFSDLIRRSTIGFQAFMERPDYRSSQSAKLVSMHIAAVSMDVGMVDGFRMLAHAKAALASIMDLCR